MIPNAVLREVSSSEIGASEQFGISRLDEAHIMTILRDTLYSDKILAVLREYGSNAWDANREAGKFETPIKVVLPTYNDLTLTIQDFGSGISQEDVFRVYTQYGASTKRGSDISVGMLGIGCKSAFAYSDSFTIISRYLGMKKTYVAVIDDTEKGVINLIHEEPCLETETGVTIQLATKREDVQEFSTKAEKVYQFFIPRPDINIEIPALPDVYKKLPSGLLWQPGWEAIHTGWVAVMGCVSYKIDLEQLKTFELGIPKYIEKNTGALYFNIGDIEINASREGLKYTNKTKKAIIDKLNCLIDEYIKEAMATIYAFQGTNWQKRVQAQTLVAMGLPITNDESGLLSSDVNIKEVLPTDIYITNSINTHTLVNISVSPHTRIVLMDANKKLDGYHLSYNDYLVRPTKVKTDIDDSEVETPIQPSLPANWDNIYKQITEMCVAAKIDGIKICKLSELEWISKAAATRGNRSVNVKHRVKSFVYTKSTSIYQSSKSDNWEPVTRAPTDEDVFVIISGFRTEGYDFTSLYIEDGCMLKELDPTRQLPTVYGYKTTAAKPIMAANCKGVEYKIWHNKLMSELTVKYKDEIEGQLLLRQSSVEYKNIKDIKDYGKSYLTMCKEFGSGHIIARMFKDTLTALIFYSNKTWRYKQCIDMLSVGNKEHKYSIIHEQYPLLKYTHINSIASADLGKIWRDYIKLVDAAKKGTP